MPKIARWVPSEHQESAIAAGLIAHKPNIALWVFDIDQHYHASQSITKNAVLICYDLDAVGLENITGNRDTIDFEDAAFGGEAAHMRQIIRKSNEPGCYGLGRTRQTITNSHVTEVRLATRAEVAKALGVSLLDTIQIEKQKPKGGWPS